MNETIAQPALTAEVATKLRAVEIAQLTALRDDIRALTNLMELLLYAVSPKDADFYAEAQALEARVGKTNN